MCKFQGQKHSKNSVTKCCLTRHCHAMALKFPEQEVVKDQYLERFKTWWIHFIMIHVLEIQGQGAMEVENLSNFNKNTQCDVVSSFCHLKWNVDQRCIRDYNDLAFRFLMLNGSLKSMKTSFVFEIQEIRKQNYIKNVIAWINHTSFVIFKYALAHSGLMSSRFFSR